MSFSGPQLFLSSASQLAPDPPASNPPPNPVSAFGLIGTGDNVDNLPLEGPTVGSLRDIRSGTAAQPDTSLNPPLKVSRTVSYNGGWAADGSQRGYWGGVADVNASPIVAQLFLATTNQAQGIAISGATKSVGAAPGLAITGITASPDAVGLQGWAQVQGLARIDANCATTNLNPVVNDAAIVAADVGKIVSGTGIPNNTFVGTVIPGVSFRLSSSATSQVDVNATATNNPVSLNIGGGAGAALGGVFIGHAVVPTAKQVDALQIFTYNDSTIDRIVNGNGQSFGRSISVFNYGNNIPGAMFEFLGGSGAQGTPSDVAIHASGGQYNSRTDACSTTNGSNLVTDPTITAADFNKTVSGANIPQNTVITSVTPGVSFTMSSSATSTANPNLLIGYQGPAITAFIQDDSDAQYGLLITSNANHQKAGIAIDRTIGSGAAMPAVFGSNTAKNTTTAAEVVGTNADANPLFFVGNGSFSQIYGILLRNSNGQHQWTVVKAANNIVNGTVAGDSVLTPRTAGTFLHIGGTNLSIIKVGQANTLGFFNATAVAQPAAYTLNAGTVSRNLPVGATLLQIEAFVRQMAADLSASNGGNGLVA